MTKLQNRLLRAMPREVLAQLAPHLVRIDLQMRQLLVERDSPMEHLYFIEEGLASIVAKTSDDREIQVGSYGREGVGSVAILLGDNQSPHEHFMHIPGSGFRISARVVLDAMQRSAALNDLMLKYAHVVQLQMAQNSVANGNYSMGERIARWLLMCHDRVEGDLLPVTHDFIGRMLAVRRSGVTQTIQTLESQRVLKAVRGCVIILNRGRLEELAGGSYGPPEAAYERLIGPFRQPPLELAVAS